MLAGLERMLVKINRGLVGSMMAVMFILVFINVVGRYGFGRSYGAAEEVSTFLMIWITYLGAGLALRQGRHAAIDLFQDVLPDRARRVLRAGLALIVFLFFALLAYHGFRFSIFGWSQITDATQLPRGLPYLAVPLGAAGLALHLLLIFKTWLNKDWEKDPTDEEPAPAEEEASWP
ncbi:MAG: TRAP transporter small permease [Thermodesulfobacteriota bacterium]